MSQRFFSVVLTLCCCALFSAHLGAQELDENCTVSILNRTAAVQADGSYILPNTPSNLGRVRARATCIKEGVTLSGQSEFFEYSANSRAVPIPDIVFGASEPVPESLDISAPSPTLDSIGATLQLTVSAVVAGQTVDVTLAEDGTIYTTSNSAVASVDANGLLTAHSSGVVLVTAVNEGTLAVERLQVIAGADSDGDGLPDDWEIARGLDPNDPTDALIDFDQDGLSTLDEFLLGLDPFNPDTDGDGLEDGEEASFGTDPLLFDTDGDGLSDGLEVQLGSDPTDPNDFSLAGALTAIEVAPASFNLIFNTVLAEASTQLTVTGQLIDGTTLDITARGANFSSSDLTICNFGLEPGRVFAGVDGSCTVTASLGGFWAQATGAVSTFSPVPLARISLPGFAHNVWVDGDYAYVATDSAGLVVVDVTNRAVPVIVNTIDTPGIARDVVVAGGVAYLADGSAGLRLFDLIDPVSPVLLAAFDTPGDARDVEVRGSVAYVADGNQGLRLIDVTDPAAPALLGQIGSLGTLGTIHGVGVDSNAGIAALAAGSRLRVIDISVPSSPVLLGTATLGGNARGVVVQDGWAHVADLSRSLTAVDLTDPASPVVGISTPTATGGLLNDVVRRDDLLFGSDIFFFNGVPITTVADPSTPTPTAILDFRTFGDDNGTGIATDGQFVYLTTDRSRMMIGQYLSLQDNEGLPPAVALTAPDASETPLGGSLLTVTADAFDDVAVQRVDFLLDGELVFTDFSRPYGFALEVPPSAATITLGARAVDYGNNVGSAEEVTVSVVADTEDPVLGVFTPAPGTLLTSGDSMIVSAEVSDNVRVTEVTFHVGPRTFVDATAPYSVTLSTPPVFDTTDLPIRIEAVDPSGNLGSVDFTVTVEPLEDLAPPQARILSPGDGDPVLPGVEVTANLEIIDDAFIDAYTLSLDGEVIGSEFFIGQSTFTDQVALIPPADALPGESFTLRLEASDFGGNVSVTETTLVVIDDSAILSPQNLDSSFDGQDLLLGPGTFTAVGPLAPRSLTMLSGAHLVGVAGQTLSLTIDEGLHLGGGASIDVNGLGFPGSGVSGSANGGTAAGLVPSTPDAGGSHGGSGNRWDAGAAGEVYDSVYVPHLAGAGGARDQDGGDNGRAGGGVIEITAASATINGEIQASGLGNISNRSGGAGGSILIDVANLAGSGLLNASGGSTSPCCNSQRTGAGGGGRIALYADVITGFDPLTQARALGGTRRNTGGVVSNYAAPGTVYVQHGGSTFGDLLINAGENSDGSDRGGTATQLPLLGTGALIGFEVDGTDALVSAAEAFRARHLGAFLRLTDAGGVDLGTYKVSAIDPSGRARLDGAGGATTAATYSGEYRFDRIELANSAGLSGSTPVETDVFRVGAGGTSRVPNAVTAGDLTIESGNRTILASGGRFTASVSGTLTIEDGASLDVSGRGFPGSGASGSANGGTAAGNTASTPDAGGSHGGAGTRWDSGAAGEVYDSVYLPRLSGGGGARDQDGGADGRAGGGVIELAVGQLVLDGEILARGLGDVSNQAGGAGGSVLINAQSTISGSGSIDVSGGATSPCCTSQRTGSGGGGRVALYTDHFTGFDPAFQVRAYGGVRRDTGNVVSTYAAPGTIFIHTGTSVFGDLLIDPGEDGSGNDRSGVSTELPGLGSGVVSAFEAVGSDALLTGPAAFKTRFEGAYVRLLDVGGSDLGTYPVIRVEADGRLRLEGAGAVATPAGYEGEYRFDRVDLRNGADLLARDPFQGEDVEIQPGNSRLPASFALNNLTIRGGADVTLAEGQAMRGSVSGVLTIESGATLDVTGLGFPGSGSSGSANGGTAAGNTASTPDAGGSHGGTGTRWDAGAAGEVFDSVYVPQLSGGGGARDQDGAANGRAGGGVIDLDVGQLVLDGAILARGLGDISNRAGGAGGSVLITAASIEGAGLIDVSGGGTVPCCTTQRTGSGGGGRIALWVDQLIDFDPVAQTRAWGGARRNTGNVVSNYAAPGTVFVHTAASQYGDLLIDAGEDDSGSDRSGPSTELPGLGAGAVTLFEVAGDDAFLTGPEPFKTRFEGAFVRLLDGVGSDLGTFGVLRVGADGRLLLEGAGAVIGAVSYEGEYRFDAVELRNGADILIRDSVEGMDAEVLPGNSQLPASFMFANLTIRSGANVTLAEGQAMRGSISGTLTIEDGATLTVSGRGFPGSNSSTANGGAPAGLTASTPDAGGSHGGAGTRWDAGAAGEVFDSVYLPRLSGGGGARDQDGADQGFAGGGVIELDVGRLVLDGAILAVGSGDASNRAGGAGGSVLISAQTTIEGTGLIDASGGGTTPCCTTQRTGSGGGGRIALYADQLLGFDPVAQTRAWGGARRNTGGVVSGYAAPGTVFVHTGTSNYGDLLIDAGEDGGGNDRSGPSTELPLLGSGAISTFDAVGADALLAGAEPFRTRFEGAYVRLLDAGGADLGTFEVLRVEADGRLLLQGAGAVIGAASYLGEYRFDTVELRNGADALVRDSVEGMDVEVLPGSTQLPASFMATNLTIRSGGDVTVAEGRTLRGTVSGTLTIEAGATLDLSGRGFPGSGSSGSANGGTAAGRSASTPDAGGSHGGVGTRWDSGSAGEVYDSVYLPQLSGGGGARDQDGGDDGRAGGGVIDLDVGTLVLDGAILARGLGDVSNRAGGAGGSVLITADTISGVGLIDVSGGSTSPCCTTQRTGSGGGGRIALYADQLLGFDPVAQTRAWGGVRRDTGNVVSNYAAPGTVFFHTAASVYGNLLIDAGEDGGGNDRSGPATELPRLGTGPVSAFETLGADALVTGSAPFLTRFEGAYVRLLDAGGGDLGTYPVIRVEADGDLLLAGAGAVVGAASYQGEYRFDGVELRNGADAWVRDPVEGMDLEVLAGNSQLPASFLVTNLTLRAGAVVTVAEGRSIRGTVSGTMTLEAGSRLDLSGRGFPGSGASGSANGGAPAGVTASTADAGGSHGGLGTRWDSGAAGESYDSVYLPQLSGGGGARDQDGSADGLAGGGLIELDVGQLVLEGEIRSRGLGDVSNRAAGAGGSVMITANSVSGAGVIDVSGGSTSPCCTTQRTGSGGGGRVAIYAAQLDGFDPGSQVIMRGGARRDTGGVISTYAGAGTTFVQVPASTFGDLRVDQGGASGRPVASTPLPSIGTGIVGGVEVDAVDPTALWIEPQDLGTLFDLGVVGMAVRIDAIDYDVLDQTTDRRRILLEGAAGVVNVGDSFQGVYRFDTVTVHGGARVVFDDEPDVGIFDVDAESTVIDNSP